jgi:Na+-driven multidrug efflux pump
VLLFPLLWGIDGIWASVVAAECMAAAVTILFLFKMRGRYHY